MKRVFFFLAGLVSIGLSGCAVTEGVGQQFQRGIQGGGQIVPNDPLRDDFGPEYD
jgi:predicted small secreted protein